MSLMSVEKRNSNAYSKYYERTGAANIFYKNNTNGTSNSENPKTLITNSTPLDISLPDSLVVFVIYVI